MEVRAFVMETVNGAATHSDQLSISTAPVLDHLREKKQHNRKRDLNECKKSTTKWKKVLNKFNLPLLCGWRMEKSWHGLCFSLPQSPAGAQWRLLINKNRKMLFLSFYGWQPRANINICLKNAQHHRKEFCVSFSPRLQFQYCATFCKESLIRCLSLSVFGQP